MKIEPNQKFFSQDYDEWAAQGALGWDFEGVLPYFRKSEDTRSEEILALPDALRYHRTGGELTTSPAERPPYSSELLEGARRSNNSIIVDFNRNGELGFGLQQLTTRNGTRCSSAKAFLSPAKSRSNLHVARNCLVTKVLVNARNKTAYGVEYVANDKVQSVTATKEVILSAGAINSPQLLLLSGIGPREQLQRYRISPIISDVRTGERMKEHILFYGMGYAVNKTTPDPNENYNALLEYLLTRKGPLSAIGVTSVNGFLQTRFGKPLKDYPDIQVGYLFYRHDASKTMAGLFELNDDTFRRLQTMSKEYDVIITAVILLHPESMGKVELQSNDPRRPPRIFGNYLTQQRDVDSLVEAALAIVKMGKVTPGVEKVVSFHIEACADKEPLSEEYFRCALPYTTTNLYHTCGSCSMGPAQAEWSVVDPRLRVKGVENLRVIDASVFTSTVSGNTNAASIMVGEKGADIIKQDWS